MDYLIFIKSLFYFTFYKLRRDPRIFIRVDTFFSSISIKLLFETRTSSFQIKSLYFLSDKKIIAQPIT